MLPVGVKEREWANLIGWSRRLRGRPLIIVNDIGYCVVGETGRYEVVKFGAIWYVDSEMEEKLAKRWQLDEAGG